MSKHERHRWGVRADGSIRPRRGPTSGRISRATGASAVPYRRFRDGTVRPTKDRVLEGETVAEAVAEGVLGVGSERRAGGVHVGQREHPQRPNAGLSRSTRASASRASNPRQQLLQVRQVRRRERLHVVVEADAQHPEPRQALVRPERPVRDGVRVRPRSPSSSSFGNRGLSRICRTPAAEKSPRQSPSESSSPPRFGKPSDFASAFSPASEQRDCRPSRHHRAV